MMSIFTTLLVKLFALFRFTTYLLRFQQKILYIHIHVRGGYWSSAHELGFLSGSPCMPSFNLIEEIDYSKLTPTSTTSNWWLDI